jgi:hypothetical protein
MVIFVLCACSFLHAPFVPLALWDEVFAEAHMEAVIRESLTTRELYYWGLSPMIVAT